MVMGGFSLSYFVLNQDWLDRKYPSPEDWNYLAKMYWRKGRDEEEEEAFGRGLTDWSKVGSCFKNVQMFCEVGMKYLPSGRIPLPKNENWDRSIPAIDVESIEREPFMPVSGTSKTGFDITSKPEAWRRAYIHVLMVLAKVSEMHVGWVRDKKRHINFPADQVVGPSNPYPKPVWGNAVSAPREEDCEPAYDTPQAWYTRILTTAGLSRDQQLAAALAYASWEDYNGDVEKARALYSWAMNLAASASPASTSAAISTSIATPVPSTPASSLLNPQTGVIPRNAPYTTLNILTAANALASHHARTGSISQALSIYLSILRARRASPEALPSQQYPPKGPDLSLTSIDSVLNWITSLPFRPSMPPTPPAGDEPFVRTAASACEDAAISNYVGEILFASATGEQGRREALSWTRDAVGIAELGIVDKKLNEKARRLCGQCLGSGLENWSKMVGVFAREEEERRTRREKGLLPIPTDAGASGNGKSGWSFWWSPFSAGQEEKSGVVSGADDGEREEGEWAKEEAMVSARRAKYLDEKLMAQLNRHISTKSNWFVV